MLFRKFQRCNSSNLRTSKSMTIKIHKYKRCYWTKALALKRREINLLLFWRRFIKIRKYHWARQEHWFEDPVGSLTSLCPRLYRSNRWIIVSVTIFNSKKVIKFNTIITISSISILINLRVRILTGVVMQFCRCRRTNK